MAFEYLGDNALDYQPCRYSGSKHLFRGPKKSLDGDYCAVIGGTETYGRFVERPFADLLETFSGRTTVNLGRMHAGPRSFVDDPGVIGICKKAQMTVIQLTGVQNMSNRFYEVHSGRNDRFVRATDLLYSIYENLDVTDVHFTGHLLSLLHKQSAEKFQHVVRGLREDWTSQMNLLIATIGRPVVLLWLADREPGQAGDTLNLMRRPYLMNEEILASVVPRAAQLVEVVASGEEIDAGFNRMIFNQLEEPAARMMLGPIAHQEVARQLAEYIAMMQ